MLDNFEGIIKIANVVLALVAGYVSVGLFSISEKRKDLKPWVALIFALLFFVAQEIFGALRAFEIWSSPFLTHIIPTVVLGFLIYALSIQIHMVTAGK